MTPCLYPHPSIRGAAGRILKRLMRGTKVNPGVVRLGLLFGTLVLLWHWLGCFYWCCLTSPCCDCQYRCLNAIVSTLKARLSALNVCLTRRARLPLK